jgi:acyl-CoA reductase-like NAD-dependent aldehyde dehydrogenase
MNIVNPATEEIIAEVLQDDLNSIQSKLEKLQSGQKLWAKKSLEERLAIIVQFGKLVKENNEALANVLTSETGKPIKQAKSEVLGALNRIAHLERDAAKYLSPEAVLTEGATKESIFYEPLGVVANISAWNFPYNVGFNVFLYALVAGNAVMYKPSEFATLTGTAIKDLLLEAGVPDYAFQLVVGDGAVGQFMLELPFAGYYFTGSYATGVHIAKSVAHKLVPVQLELGGKDPLYIMDDVADVKQAAINAAEGAFYNNGQSCCAVERIYVHEKIYDQFITHFVEEVVSYKMGDPTDDQTFIGPVTRKQQIKIIEAQIQDALSKGAKLLCGGELISGKGYYLAPTVMAEVNHHMSIMKEESFGPIIGIQKVTTDEEAFALMQDCDYGLTAAVFSTDEKRARQILDQMNTGTVYWNCCDRVSPNVPWSGRKNSGLGSTLSHHGIRAFTQPKAYHARG